MQSQYRAPQTRYELDDAFLVAMSFSLVVIVLLVGSGLYSWYTNRTPKTSVTPLEQQFSVRRATMREVPNVPTGLFNYGNAMSFAGLMKHGLNEAIARAHPYFQLRYTLPLHGNPGSGSGIAMLIDDEMSIAQSNRPLFDAELERAKTKNLTLEQVPIAIDALVVYVHPSLAVTGVSISQLQDIYRGRITNWNQLGGPNLPIVPITTDPKVASAARQMLGEAIDQLGSSVRIVGDTTSALRQVAETPGAVSFESNITVVGQQTVRLVPLAKADSTNYVSPLTPTGELNKVAIRDGSYPVTRRAFIIFRRDRSLDEQAGIAYANLLLTDEGQAIVDKAGFVPLR